jgi:hypothetical protein
MGQIIDMTVYEGTRVLVGWLQWLYVSHTMSETEVGILTLTSEYDGINPTINMAGMASYSLPTIDYYGCSTRLLTLLNTDLIF